MRERVVIRTIESEMELMNLEGQYLDSLKEIHDKLTGEAQEEFHNKVGEARKLDYPEEFQAFDALMEEYKEEESS